MPLSTLDETDELLHQFSGDPDAPPLVFLPGVHGDWTPQVRARSLLTRELRLVEIAYPRKNWSLGDFARSLKRLLDRLGIRSAHLVGESFGSLVAWQFGIENPSCVRSFVLLGGFTRAPRFRLAGMASAALKHLPTSLLESAIDRYVSRKTCKGEQRGTSSHGTYPVTRTHRGRLATAHRMSIIQRADFRSQLSEVRFPIRYLAGTRDIIVPVRREVATLMKHLPPNCDFQSVLLAEAPHALIASHPEPTANQIARWVHETEGRLGSDSPIISIEKRDNEGRGEQ